MNPKHIEECKKWILFDKTQFNNYQHKIDELNSIKNLEELYRWINDNKNVMNGLSGAGIVCIQSRVLLDMIHKIS